MSFEAIQGQQQAVEFLKRSIAHERVAHAYLFSGPEGVGKQSTAQAFAQSMNCQQAQAQEACGTCQACRKIEHRVHPDIHWISPDGQSLKIEQVRELFQREIHLRPLEGRTRFFILDQADALTTEAANSLLKILEEPPAEVVIILITNQPFALLPTIRSRCQEVRFHPLEVKVLTRWLQARLTCTQKEAMTLARLSVGRPGEALRLADPEVKGYRQQVLELAQNCQSESWPQLALKMTEGQVDVGEALMLMLSWFRDLLILAQGGDEELVINQDQMEKLRLSRQQETVSGLGHKCQVILRAIDQIKMNINLQLLLENLFIELGKAAAVAG